MSEYSGKCDFCDHLFINTENEKDAFDKFNGTKLYICQPLPDDFSFRKVLEEKINIPEKYYKKIEYHSMNDLIPYYPYLICSSCCDNHDSKSSTVCLSGESYVDREEREILEFRLKEFIRIYNRCKRNKIEFNIDSALKEISIYNWNIDALREIGNRVKEKGKKAGIEGIHLTMHEYYRKNLVDEMLKHGINPCKYGYERFLSN